MSSMLAMEHSVYAVSPLKMEAPTERRKPATSECPFIMASCRGVLPYLSWMLGIIPWPTRNLTSSRWPLLAARCSAERWS